MVPFVTMFSISRSNSKILAFSLLVGFFVMSLLLIKRETPPLKRDVAVNKTAVPTDAAPVSTPESAQVTMNEFHRAETKNGKTVWEIRAKIGSYSPKTNEAEVETAQLHFYKEDGSVTQLNAARARLNLLGTSINDADATGGVTVVTDNGITIKTERAQYHKAKEQLLSPTEVHIVGNGVEITGKQMLVLIREEEARLSGGVTTLIKPQEKNTAKDSQ